MSFPPLGEPGFLGHAEGILAQPDQTCSYKYFRRLLGWVATLFEFHDHLGAILTGSVLPNVELGFMSSGIPNLYSLRIFRSGSSLILT